MANLLENNLSHKPPGENLEKNIHAGECKIPIEALKHLFSRKQSHLINTYAAITRDPKFSGFVREDKVRELAAATNTDKRTTKKHLEQLVDAGLLTLAVTKGKGLYMAMGADRFAATCGKSKIKFVQMKRNMPRGYYTTLAYGIFISEQFQKKTHGRRTEKSTTTPNTVAGLKKTQISSSYTQKFMRSQGAKRTIQCISRQRSKARSLDMVAYKRSFHVKRISGAEGSISEMVGGHDIALRFDDFLQSGQITGSEKLSYRKSSGTFAWFVEHPALFTGGLDFSKRSIKKDLSDKSRSNHYLLHRYNG